MLQRHHPSGSVQAIAGLAVASLAAVAFGTTVAHAAAVPKPTSAIAAKPATAPAPPPAAAKAPAAPTSATEWFEKGSIHHKLAEFTEAIACYREAYRLDPDATYFYNMGLAYRQLGKYGEALRYFEMVLVDDPTTPLRPTIEKGIAELRRLKETKPLVPEGSGLVAPPSGSGGAGAVGPATGPATGPGSPGTGALAPPSRTGLGALTIVLAAGGGAVAAGVAILVIAIVVAGPSPAAYARGFPGRIYDFTERP